MMSLFIMGSMIVLAGTINNILALIVILMYLIMAFKHDMDWFMSYGEFMLDGLSFFLGSGFELVFLYTYQWEQGTTLVSY